MNAWLRITCVAAMSLVAIYNILRVPNKELSPIGSNKIFLLALYPILLMLLIWCFKGYELSPDTEHILSWDVYEKAHPIAYGIIVKLLYGLFGSIKAIVVSQILLMAVACWAIIWFIYNHKLPWIYAVLGTAIVIYGTSYSFIFVIAIKDAFYYPFYIILMVGLCSWCLNESKRDFGFISIGLIGVSIFRYDGQLVVIGTLLALLIACRHSRKMWTMLALTGTTLLCMIFCNILLPKLLHADTKVGVGTKYAMPAELICEVVVHGGDITEEEKERISQVIMPIDKIRKFHSNFPEHWGQKYIWGRGEYSFARSLSGKGRDIIELFIPIASRNPKIVITHLLNRTHMLTRLVDSPAACFFISLLLFCIVITRRIPSSLLLPFVPVFISSFTCIFVATTYELRYALPIVGGSVVLYLYSHILLYSKHARTIG